MVQPPSPPSAVNTVWNYQTSKDKKASNVTLHRIGICSRCTTAKLTRFPTSSTTRLKSPHFLCKRLRHEVAVFCAPPRRRTLMPSMIVWLCSMVSSCKNKAKRLCFLTCHQRCRISPRMPRSHRKSVLWECQRKNGHNPPQLASGQRKRSIEEIDATL